MATIPEQIEDAILALLETFKLDPPDGYARTLRAFGGDIRSARRALIVPMPAILVSYGGALYKSEGGDCVEVTSLWEVIVADDAHVGEGARRRGDDAGHPGTYKMLQDARGLLIGQAVVTNTQPLELVEEQRLDAIESISAFRQRWRTRYVEAVQ